MKESINSLHIHNDTYSNRNLTNNHHGLQDNFAMKDNLNQFQEISTKNYLSKQNSHGMIFVLSDKKDKNRRNYMMSNAFTLTSIWKPPNTFDERI